MDFSTADKILKGFSIPLQPLVVSKILRLMPDLVAISTVIEQDACLTASVLKVANHISADLKIKLVAEAVQALGTEGISAILNVQLLRKAAVDDAQDEALTEFWKINNDMAFACSLLAKNLDIEAVEDAYYLGLFHNIGMLVMWQKHKDYFDVISTGETCLINVLDIENNHFTCSHSSVGYYVARGMSLSKNVCESIKLHHDVARAFTLSDLEPEILTNLSVLKTVEHILDEASLLHGCVGDLEWQTIKQPVLEQLGLSGPDFLDLEEYIKEETLMRSGF